MIRISELVATALHSFEASATVWPFVASDCLGLLTLVLACIPLIPAWRSRGIGRPWVFSVFLILAIFMFRWFFLAAGEQNPDESQLLAASMTFLRSPIAFFSLDLGTHGPLSPFPLAVLQVLGFAPDYGLAKLAGLGLMTGCALFVYFSLRLVFSEIIARIGGLMAAWAVCSMWFWDFAAYNGETPVLFETFLGLWLVTLFAREGKGVSVASSFFAGFALGCIPLTKIQGVPGGGVVGLLGLLLLSQKIRRKEGRAKQALMVYVAGSLFPLAAFLGVVAWQGQLDDFYIRYVLDQFAYAGYEQLGFLVKIQQTYASLWLVDARALPFYFLSTSLICVAALLLFLFFKTSKIKSQPTSTQLLFTLFSFLLFVVEFISVAIPGTGFHHYFLLLYFPACLFCASCIGFAENKMPHKVALIFYIAVIFIIIPYNFSLSSAQSFLAPGSWSSPKYGYVPLPYALMPRDAVSQKVSEINPPGNTAIYIWGWRDSLYVDTGLQPAIRTNMFKLLPLFRNVAYHRDQIAKELDRVRPALIIDAIAPSSFRLSNREEYGIELYPELADFVHKNYALAAVVDDVRVYALKTQPPQGVSPPKS